MRLVRTDRWDDATREEWEDLKRSGRGVRMAIAATVVYMVARLVTPSYVEQLGIAACVGAVVAVASGWLEKRRSRVDSAETNSDPST